MNLFLDTKLVIACFAQRWWLWRLLSKNSVKYLFYTLVFSSLTYPAFAIDKNILEAAETAFKKGQYDSAELQFLSIEKDKTATPPDLAITHCRLGVIASIRNQNDRALELLPKSLKNKNLSKGNQFFCQYALLQLYVLKKQDLKAKELLQEVEDVQFNPTYVARLWALGIEVGQRVHDSSLEKKSTQKLYEVMKKAKLNEVQVKVLKNKRFAFADVKTKVALVTEEELSPQDQNKAQTEVKEDVKVSTPSDFKPPFWNEYQKRQETLKSDSTTVMRVGVILPVGNQTFSTFNIRILRALTAFASSSAVKGVHYKFSIATAVADDPSSAEAAAQKLILTDHVHAILGSYLITHMAGIMPLARYCEVPVFSFGPVAYAREIEGSIRMGILAESHAEAILQHLKDDLNFHSLAILAGEDTYGVEMATQMQRVAQKAKFSVLRTQYYSNKATDFSEPVKQLFGPTTSPSYKVKVNEMINKAKEEARLQKRKLNMQDVRLPANVDFDALFLPESISKTRNIVSTFAYNEAKEMRYLGDMQWEAGSAKRNFADVFMDGARYPSAVEGGFYPYLRTALQLQKNTYSLDRQAFDAMILIRQAHHDANSNQGSLLFRALESPTFKAEGTTVVSGINTQLGEPRVKMRMMGLENGQPTTRLKAWSSNTTAK